MKENALDRARILIIGILAEKSHLQAVVFPDVFLHKVGQVERVVVTRRSLGIFDKLRRLVDLFGGNRFRGVVDDKRIEPDDKARIMFTFDRIMVADTVAGRRVPFVGTATKDAHFHDFAVKKEFCPFLFVGTGDQGKKQGRKRKKCREQQSHWQKNSNLTHAEPIKHCQNTSKAAFFSG